MAECSSCGAEIPTNATECPQCGEVFSRSLIEEAEKSPSGRREKLLFFMGFIFILLGGPGLALGSLLHDMWRIPIIGLAFNEFGWMNRLAAAIGLVILIVGVVFLILSAKLSRSVGENEYDIGTPRRT